MSTHGSSSTRKMRAARASSCMDSSRTSTNSASAQWLKCSTPPSHTRRADVLRKRGAFPSCCAAGRLLPDELHVADVVRPVPGVQREQEVDGDGTVFGVCYRLLEIGGLHRLEQL